MFGFRKKVAPTRCPTNPGIGVGGRVAFVRGEKKWTQDFDVIDIAASVLKEHGELIKREKTWLVHKASQFTLMPQLVSFKPLDSGGVQTATTIQVNHPVLVPDGLFEYQHSTGNTMADSICKGIKQWVQVDFAPLLDALQAKPASCTAMEMSFPAKDGKPARIRRAVLGPVMHFMQKPPAGQTDGGKESNPDEHPFCPCCMLTNSFSAFKELMEGDQFCGLRLFAARGEDGAPQADCRLNGDDWEPGAQALREYVKTWTPAGYEFRKQYVVLQNFDKNTAAS
jgi:Family of unknown function (DUF6348)